MSWVTADEAARTLGTTRKHVAVLAHRLRWERRRRSANWKQTEYAAQDVAAEYLRRAETADRQMNPTHVI